ncbi:MAG: hypothetical protein ACLR5T_01075 [Veillonella sp.]
MNPKVANWRSAFPVRSDMYCVQALEQGITRCEMYRDKMCA